MMRMYCCPVCNSQNAQLFLQRKEVPVHQNLALPGRLEALNAVRGKLDLANCPDCGFVFNAAFDSRKLDYGANYDNTQSCSPFFARYMSDLAQYLLTDANLHNCRIVEVGCGKGDFLRLLMQDPAQGNSGIGFDPSYVGPETEMGGRLRFERRFYDGDCVDVPADVVVCRHVIEHVPQPLELLRSVRHALRDAKSPRIYFETPCVEWILRNRVIWDFFYEHCSLFTAASLRTAFERTGFEVHSVKHVFGGQYLWLEAGLANQEEFSADAGEIPMLARQYACDEARLREEWRIRIASLREIGPVAVWGAGAKGTTFVHLADPRCELVDCLVDLNPNKQGKFVPGTGHPIVGLPELARRGIRTAILMNPNYREENERLLAAAGMTVKLIE